MDITSIVDAVRLADTTKLSAEQTKFLLNEISHGRVDGFFESSTTTHCSLIHLLSERMCIDVLVPLVDKCVEIEKTDRFTSLLDDSGKTPLHYIVTNKSSQSEEFLIAIDAFEKVGVFLNCLDHKDRNVLHVACEYLNEHAVHAICKKFKTSQLMKNIISQKTIHGFTPLRVAINHECMNPVVFFGLFEMGANFFTHDEENKTIFDICNEKHKENPEHPFLKSTHIASQIYDSTSRSIAVVDAIQNLNSAEPGTFAVYGMHTRTLHKLDDKSEAIVISNGELSKCVVSSAKITCQSNVGGMDHVMMSFLVTSKDPVVFVPPYELIMAIKPNASELARLKIKALPMLYVEINMQEFYDYIYNPEKAETNNDFVTLTVERDGTEKDSWHVVSQSMSVYRKLPTTLRPAAEYWTKEVAEAKLAEVTEKKEATEKDIENVKDVIEESEVAMKKQSIRITPIFADILVTISLTKILKKKTNRKKA